MRWPPCAASLASVLGLIKRRRHPRRRGHRPRDRVVSERLCRRHTRPAPASSRICWRSFRCSRTPLRRRHRRVADGRVRGRRRAGGGGEDAAEDPRRRARASSARPTRISPSRSAARASCSSIAARTMTATRRASSRSSACRRRRFPTTSPSSATPPTASPACRAGARSPPPPCSPSTATSSRFPPIRASGASTPPTQVTLAADAQPRTRERVPLPRSGDAAHHIPLFNSVDELRWRGPTKEFAALCS